MHTVIRQADQTGAGTDPSPMNLSALARRNVQVPVFIQPSRQSRVFVRGLCVLVIGCLLWSAYVWWRLLQ